MNPFASSPSPSTSGRRDFLRLGAAAAVATGTGLVPGAETPRQPVNPTATWLPSVRVLMFDVFGTVVDCRTSIIREGQLLTRRTGVQVDWGRFADQWRAGYRPALDRIRAGDAPWANLDTLHRRILDDLLPRFGIKGLSEAEIVHLNQAWHRLMPWPDSVTGLRRLRSHYTLATLSNAHVALLVNMAKNAGLPWDCILSAEMSGHYKTAPEAYLTATRLLALEPAEIMMVAAHRNDILAARKLGFHTAFVTRPLEYGPEGTPDTVQPAEVDLIATDFLHLAQQLEC